MSPAIWAKFRAALDQMETAMVEAGWLDKEDLQAEVETTKKLQK